MPQTKQNTTATTPSHRARQATGTESAQWLYRRTASKWAKRWKLSQDGSIFSSQLPIRRWITILWMMISYRSMCLRIIKWKVKKGTCHMVFSERWSSKDCIADAQYKLKYYISEDINNYSLQHRYHHFGFINSVLNFSFHLKVHTSRGIHHLDWK